MKLKYENIGFGNKDNTEIYKFDVLFEGDYKDVHYIDYGCSCVSGKLNKRKNKLECQIDFNKLMLRNPTNTVQKYIKIYLDPTEQEYIADKELRKIPNSKKRVLTFLVMGMVDKVK